MGLIKYKLGELIEQQDERNSTEEYTIKDVRGISTDKAFIQTKANMQDVSLTPYKVVIKNDFAYVADTSRRGDKIAIAYNNDKNIIISAIYTVFRIKRQDLLLSDYLFIYFNRPEFDRYARFHSWGSARETFDWDEMCNIEIELPPRSIQEKYVDVYKSLLENQKKYEQDLDDLKLVCDAYIEKLKREMPSEPIGPYITRCDRRNGINGTKNVKGLSTKKEFRPAQSRVDINKLEKYKVVEHNDFVFVPTTDTWKVLAFAYNTESYPVVVSPIYEVFSVDTKVILPGYLALWLKRKDFDRYARFHSWGSARENFTFENMCDVKIPIPSIKIQQDIVNIYDVCNLRKEINEKLKEQIKSICPILIKGAVEEAQKEA